MLDPIAHWRLDDNAASTVITDCSGNGYHGTAQQNTNLLHTFDGMAFDGTSDYIDTGNTFQAVFRDNFSINGWIKLYAPSGDYQVLVGAWGYSGKAGGVEMFVNSTNSRFVVVYTTGMYNDINAYSDEEIPFNIWLMFTMIVTKIPNSLVHIDIYQNGILQSALPPSNNEKAINMANFTTDKALSIGSVDGSYAFANGLIDNVMIFNYALSADQIRELYDNHNSDNDNDEWSW